MISWRKHVANAAVTFVVIVLIVAGMEIFFRYIKPVTYLALPGPAEADAWSVGVHQKGSIPGLDYEIKPGVDTVWHDMRVRTNSEGMRDRERVRAKRDGITRIAAVGDSYTFGLGVDETETWPAVLERLLNQNGERYEVLNFGVCGYNSHDEALIIRNKVLAWNPDLIVIGYVTNDPETEAVQPLHAFFHRHLWWQHSALLRAIALAKRTYVINKYCAGDILQYWYLPNGEQWKSVPTAFKDIAVSCGARVPVLLAIFPDPPLEPPKGHPLLDVYRQVSAAALDNGFNVMNLKDVFAGHNYDDLRIPRWRNHCNAQGYALAAEGIRDYIQQHQNALLSRKSP